MRYLLTGYVGCKAGFRLYLARLKAMAAISFSPGSPFGGTGPTPTSTSTTTSIDAK
jgi:hypothetical protein